MSALLQETLFYRNPIPGVYSAKKKQNTVGRKEASRYLRFPAEEESMCGCVCVCVCVCVCIDRI